MPRVSFAQDRAPQRVSTWATVLANAPPAPQASTHRTSEAPTLRIVGQWYCPIDTQHKDFIQDNAVQIAKDYNCSYVAIRAGIHDTETSIDPQTGRVQYIKSPWHYTAEFQLRGSDRHMAAHIYTNTHRITVEGKPYLVTRGLQHEEQLRRDGIAKNPQRFPDRPPKYPQMKKYGKPFGKSFSSQGYRYLKW